MQNKAILVDHAQEINNHQFLRGFGEKRVNGKVPEIAILKVHISLYTEIS